MSRSPPSPSFSCGSTQIDRVAELAVPLLVLRHLLAEEARRVALEHLAVHGARRTRRRASASPARKRVSSSAVLTLRSLAAEPHAVAQVAHRVADGEAGVPQRVQHLLGHRLDVGVGPVRIEEEQVDVGARVQLAAPVAALGDQRAGAGRAPCSARRSSARAAA